MKHNARRTRKPIEHWKTDNLKILFTDFPRRCLPKCQKNKPYQGPCRIHTPWDMAPAFVLRLLPVEATAEAAATWSFLLANSRPVRAPPTRSSVQINLGVDGRISSSSLLEQEEMKRGCSREKFSHYPMTQLCQRRAPSPAGPLNKP